MCGLVFAEENFSAANQTQIYTYQGGSSHSIILHFCPTCATHLYAYPTAYKNKVVVRANTLEKIDFKPQQAIFAESAFSWDQPIAMSI